MSYTYVAPTLTEDNVIFQLINNQLTVLLVKRGKEPFKGQWALPGGYNAAGDTTTDAMKRVLLTKTGIKMSELRFVEQLYTFDTVARDPRGHAVSVSYMGLCRDLEPKHTASTENPVFVPVKDLPELAYDHASIVNYAHERLQSKVNYSNVVFALLPDKFTLTELQSAYEAIFGHKLDKRNFRKKFLSLELISPIKKLKREGAHRPAQLYAFNKQGLQILTRSFE
jgi:8-oxo-dGTP diphosphatase